MHIAFVLSDLGLGGAQRVAGLLAGGMAEAGHMVTVFTLDNGPVLHPLPASVTHQPLGLAGETHGLAAKLSANLRRLTGLRRALRQFSPDAVISFVTPVNVTTLLASLRAGWPVIVSERSDPAAQPWPLAWRLLRRLSYPLADALVMQTRQAAETLPTHRRKRVIANPVPAAFPAAAASAAVPRPCLLAAGRLTRQKGFDLLLEAFAGLMEKHPDWHLLIAGEGEERLDLEAQRRALGLQERVHLPGFQADMPGILASADLFVLPSRFEGFPNILCEAMAAGLACIAADCPSGPADIITTEKNGLLVDRENATALRSALDRLMSDAELRARLGNQAKSVSQRFQVAGAVNQWLTLIGDCRTAKDP